MKKVQKTIQTANCSTIDYDQLSQVKGGASYPRDLFTGDVVSPYDVNPPA